jgi:negative regulator of flagellin synthesis FlgM
MNINISSIQKPVTAGIGNDKTNAQAKPGGTGDAAVRSTSGSDSVNLSATGTEMSNLESRINASDGIDRQKVEDIKDALKRGDYPFNPEKIAENMLHMERLLS